MAPSMVVLLNTPLILLPMRLIPNDSPLFDVFLQSQESGERMMIDRPRRRFSRAHAAREEKQSSRGGKKLPKTKCHLSYNAKNSADPKQKQLQSSESVGFTRSDPEASIGRNYAGINHKPSTKQNRHSESLTHWQKHKISPSALVWILVQIP